MSHENVLKASRLEDPNCYVSFLLRERAVPNPDKPTSSFTLHDSLTIPLGFNTIEDYVLMTRELQFEAVVLKSFIATKARVGHLQNIDLHNISKEFASPAIRLGVPTYCYFHHNVDMSMAFNKLK